MFYQVVGLVETMQLEMLAAALTRLHQLGLGQVITP